MSQPSKIIATTNVDISQSQNQKHYLTIPTVLSKKQIYEIQKQSLIIPLQYADDIGYVFISKDNTAMQYQQSMLPQLLMKRNLTCNESKTETYSITRDGDNTYKNYRYLGSLLDTTEDFKRRKILAMNSMRTYDPVWKNSNVSIFTKIRIFDSLITPIMLHNSHLWTQGRN